MNVGKCWVKHTCNLTHTLIYILTHTLIYTLTYTLTLLLTMLNNVKCIFIALSDNRS
jgi:hypothetical protein